MTYTATDGASNFSKAFTEFGKKNEGESDEGSDSEQETSDEVVFHDLQQILTNTASETGTDADDTTNADDTTDIDYTIITLLGQLNCNSHTLNLTATTDANKALLNSL